MAQAIYTNNTIIEIQPKNNSDFELEELYPHIGRCYLEVVYLKNNKIMIIDEEGKLKNLPFNKIATEIAHKDEAIYDVDYIAGNVVICDTSELR